MYFTVPLALFGWIPAGLLLFWWLGARRGLVAIFLLGWLLLPLWGYRWPGLKYYSKSTAITFSALLAVLVYDSKVLATFRLKPIDYLMLAWCLSPAASSISNDLGIYDAFSIAIDQLLLWGIPYWLGRLYFRSMADLKDLALGFVLGGMLYVPLCVWESRMSPMLHRWVYGFSFVDLVEAKRYGGWRPAVFMQHGLAVSLFMASAAIIAVWFWRRRMVSTLLGVRISYIACTLVVVTVLCRSVGSIVLLAAGIAVMLVSERVKARFLFVVLILAAPAYMTTRATGIWSGQDLIDMATKIDEGRRGSIATRITSENLFAAKARQRPFFGWGGWGRSAASSEDGNTWAIPDGFWILTFGTKGAVGLIAFTLMILVPIWFLLWRTPRLLLFDSAHAAALSLAVVVMVYMIDCLFNAMLNPAVLLAVGGLSGLESYDTPRYRVPVAVRRPGTAMPAVRARRMN